jgi:hypothetical protein
MKNLGLYMMILSTFLVGVIFAEGGGSNGIQPGELDQGLISNQAPKGLLVKIDANDSSKVEVFKIDAAKVTNDKEAAAGLKLISESNKITSSKEVTGNIAELDKTSSTPAWYHCHQRYYPANYCQNPGYTYYPANTYYYGYYYSHTYIWYQPTYTYYHGGSYFNFWSR